MRISVLSGAQVLWVLLGIELFPFLLDPYTVPSVEVGMQTD